MNGHGHRNTQSGLAGALDGSIEVSRADARREWKVTKAKGGEDGISTPFQLETVVLNLDEDGIRDRAGRGCADRYYLR